MSRTLHLCPRCSRIERTWEAAIAHYIGAHGIVATDVGPNAEAVVLLPSSVLPIADTVQLPLDNLLMPGLFPRTRYLPEFVRFRP